MAQWTRIIKIIIKIKRTFQNKMKCRIKSINWKRNLIEDWKSNAKLTRLRRWWISSKKKPNWVDWSRSCKFSCTSSEWARSIRIFLQKKETYQLNANNTASNRMRKLKAISCGIEICLSSIWEWFAHWVSRVWWKWSKPPGSSNYIILMFDKI